MGRTWTVGEPGRYPFHESLTGEKLLPIWKTALSGDLDVDAERGTREPVGPCAAEPQAKKHSVVENVDSARPQTYLHQDVDAHRKKETVAGLRGDGILFRTLQKSNLPPSVVVDSPTSSANQKDLYTGRELHAYIERRGPFRKSISISTTSVNAYSKCSPQGIPEDLFGGICIRNAVAWNALVDLYIQHGRMHSALAAFHQMTQECIFPSSVTYAYVLKACAGLGDQTNGKAVHAQIVSDKLPERDSIVGTALIYMYAKCMLLREAEDAFGTLVTRDVVSWNTLISGYVLHELGEKALECFLHMQSEGFSPNAVTFIGILKACASIRALSKGQALHAKILKEGLLAKQHVGNALLAMYAKCGILSKAQEVFDGLVVKDVVSWSTLISGYSLHSCPEEALCCFNQMKQEGLSPNSVSCCCTLKACSRMGTSNGGQELHALILKEGWIRKDLRVGSALLDMYAKCGALHKACEVFDELPIRSTLVWTALISGYAQAGRDNVAFELFCNMIREGKRPDSITYVALLNACSNEGRLNEGQLCFRVLIDYGMSPTLRHFTRIVDLFARAGQLETAATLICKMPFSDNLTLWHSFLGACQKWANVQFGRWAFQHSIQCDTQDAAAYVIMSNVNEVA